MSLPFKQDTSPRFERRLIEIDTMPLPFVVGGEGDPVVLLHLPVNPMHVYSKTMPGLAEHFRVYNLDIRPVVALWWYEGHGSLLRFTTDYLFRFLDHMKLEKIDLVASFMGAGTAMALAIRHPERVRRLVLISALGITRRPENSIFALIFRLMNLPGMRTMFHVFMTSPWFQKTVLSFDRKVFGPRRVHEFFYDPPKDGLDYHLTQLYDGLADPPNPFAFETFINVIQYMRYREIRFLIPTIHHKTLLLFGEEDVLLPPRIARLYKAAIPNSELHLIPKTRVFLHWEAADDVNRLITEFLKPQENALKSTLPHAAEHLENQS